MEGNSCIKSGLNTAPKPYKSPEQGPGIGALTVQLSSSRISPNMAHREARATSLHLRKRFKALKSLRNQQRKC